MSDRDRGSLSIPESMAQVIESMAEGVGHGEVWWELREDRDGVRIDEFLCLPAMDIVSREFA